MPDYLIRLRPLPGADPIKALRMMLKFALRTCKLRAVTVTEEPDETRPHTTDPARPKER